MRSIKARGRVYDVKKVRGRWLVRLFDHWQWRPAPKTVRGAIARLVRIHHAMQVSEASENAKRRKCAEKISLDSIIFPVQTRDAAGRADRALQRSIDRTVPSRPSAGQAPKWGPLPLGPSVGGVVELTPDQIERAKQISKTVVAEAGPPVTFRKARKKS